MKTKLTTNHAQGHNANMVLAVSGHTPNFQKVVEELLDAVDDATDACDGYFQKEYASQLFEIVLRDFYQAACASGAVGTVAARGALPSDCQSKIDGECHLPV